MKGKRNSFAERERGPACGLEQQRTEEIPRSLEECVASVHTLFSMDLAGIISQFDRIVYQK